MYETPASAGKRPERPEGSARRAAQLPATSQAEPSDLGASQAPLSQRLRRNRGIFGENLNSGNVNSRRGSSISARSSPVNLFSPTHGRPQAARRTPGLPASSTRRSPVMDPGMGQPGAGRGAGRGDAGDVDDVVRVRSLAPGEPGATWQPGNVVDENPRIPEAASGQPTSREQRLEAAVAQMAQLLTSAL